MKKILLTILLVATCYTFAQEAQIPAEETSPVQWGISGQIINIFFVTTEVEAMIPLRDHTILSPGIGFGGTIPIRNAGHLWAVPHHITINLGFSQKIHFLETGLYGFFYGDSNSEDRVYSFGGLLGYRYLSAKNRFLFKTNGTVGPAWFTNYSGTESTSAAALWSFSVSFGVQL